jgi:serine/threonine-protein kinase RsbW
MDDNNPQLTVTANFCLDWQTVSHALDLVEAFLQGFEADANIRARLAIIVEELVANIVEHGQSSIDAPISLILARNGTDIDLVLSDAGVVFDASIPVLQSACPPERGGGAGLALVQSWVSAMSYRRVDGRNILEVIIPANG